MPNRTCSLDGCDRDLYCRGWCVAHHARWRKHGDPGPAVVRRRWPSTVCIVDACEERSKTRQMCKVHYQRWWRYGDPLVVTLADHGRAWTGDAVGYAGVHSRLRVERGKAAEQICVRCGGSADEWAYDHAAPNEQQDETTGKPYSTDLSHYLPLCLADHRRFDVEDTRVWTCSVDDCEGAHKAHGLCRKHYLSAWRAGRP